MKAQIERTKTFALVTMVWVMNSLLRVVFGVMSTQGSLLDNPVSPLVEHLLIITFLILGVLGFITSYGLLKLKLWGFLGVVVVSFSTIVFDIYGMTIQFTAALGFIAPVIALLYLVPRMFKMGMIGQGYPSGDVN